MDDAVRVFKLEELCKRSPALYRLYVGAWTAFGLLVAWLVPLAILAILAGIGWVAVALGSVWILAKAGIKLILPLVLILGGVLKALWTKVEPPEGLRIRRDEYPELFALIDEVAAETGAPVPDHVLLQSNLNAGVAEIPVNALLPIHRSHLVLGVQLLAAVSRDEFKAVLAHEFGHLSHAHGRFAGWIYRTRRAWAGIAEQVSGPVGFFVRWFWPRYNVRTFVLARQDEYEADRVAALATSPQTATDALVRVELADAHADEYFWDPLRKRANNEALPPNGVIKALVGHLESKPDEAWWDLNLSRALRAKSDLSDTHPCLHDRAKALAVKPRVPPPFSKSAARELLGARLDHVAEYFSSQWSQGIREYWREAHREAQRRQQTLSELEGRAADLTARESLDLGLLAEEFGRTGTALAAYQHALNLEPEHPHALLRFGRLLLAEGDDEGIAMVERARSLDADVELGACVALASYFEERGDAARHRAELERGKRAYEHAAARMAEAEEVSPHDTLLPPELDDATRRELIDHLHAADIEAAWIARKQTSRADDPPVYVLALQPDSWSSDREDDPAARAQSSFERACAGLPLHRDDWIAVTIPSQPWIEPKMKAVAGAELF
jgi:Zn-dependent protease with chaperone function/tetratricopeptide (TPR) repeat protein